MDIIICCIDGGIGADKSSVFYELKKRGYYVIKDLDCWGWCIERYYKDPSRWAFTLQMAILDSMASWRNSIDCDNCVVFIERCPVSCLVCHKIGVLSSEEVKLVHRYCNAVRFFPRVTHKLVTPADICTE